MSARAAYFTSPRRIELLPLPHEVLAPEQVRVRSELSAISGGTELLFYRGELEAGVPVDATLPWAGTLRYPLRYGYAAVGSIVEQGSAITQALVGQRVFGFQPHQEEFVERLDRVIRLPQALSSERAALLPSMETAVSLMMDGAPIVGEWVAVLGQGVIGQLLAALLVRSGAEHVLLIDGRPARLEHSRKLCGPARAEWSNAPGAAHAHRFDLVYELTGDPSVLDAAQALARYEGRIVVGSWYGSRRASVDFGTHAHRNRNSLLFSQVSRIDSRYSARFDAARRLGVALAWLERLELETLITHRMAFERIAGAYQLLDEGREAACQILITYGAGG
jgi:2-desacetyl-2-hydroxyethyl bacteriochlorophyllide A dehydrogenase